ncbi:mechanosensitive ion channel family protein [Sphingomonas solaris]|uniref:Small-conductance mechanosensitive channel n=1 Tax=Alterirhizorhabdus solaris TaxID=2529389 RepID=A0A558RCZ8_9SPHN|nr:mechanosensitive ion channel [Sphingomonas solaris]TVV77357.1 mechanosensitive ion channel [Sphingomonas solaris]
MDIATILLRRIRDMGTELVRILPQLGIALLLLVVTYFAARSARRIAERLLSHTDLRGSLVNLVETLVGVAIWVLGLLIAMSVVLPGVTPANILAVLGLGSVAVGFAFKDIFENFLAGVLIMLRKQMRIGDFIRCQDVEGRIEMISLRDTHLRHLSNELVVVPNAYLFKNPVEVVTQSQLRRHEIEVGVAYDVDLEVARKVILEAVSGIGVVHDDRPVEVYAKEFGDSSINFLVRWWAGSKPVEMHQSRDEVVRAIKRALDDAGLEIPFPYRTLTFKEPLPLVRAQGTQAAPHEEAGS